MYPNTPASEKGIRGWLKQACDSNNYSQIIYKQKPIGHTKLIPSPMETPNVAEVSCVIGDEQLVGSGLGMAVMFKYLQITFTTHPELEGVLIYRIPNISSHTFIRMGLEKIENPSFDVFLLRRTLWQVLEQRLQ
ncbi:MAG: hypothetical protein M1514_03185 [Patescibacteria group bacterium]|nr:hypothetical protein [Patescibacteria group bacterium]